MKIVQPLLALVLLSSCIVSVKEGDRVGPPDDRQRAPGTDQDPPRIASKVKGMERHRGLFDTYLDRDTGEVWLELPAPDSSGTHAECLYYEGLTTGLGSNPVGLDRGQVRGPWVVRFRRVGERVFLERPNLRFRALSDDPAEVAATEQSFATSVLWSADAEARDPNGAVLVNLTSFLVRDAHGVTGTLARSGQGSWSLDAGRSALDTNACLAFPDNLEFEALLTFKGSQPGSQVRATAPDSTSVTLTQHHSLVRLPDDNYRPREFDPRAGGMAVQFRDYAAGLDESMDVRWAVRHRLEKTDPTAASSPVVEPIVYYVDPGAPEPVRGALIEGASWWAQAFEAAGFQDAFRVEVLPEGAHPLDVRYNVIQWVHRSTRGWSYGNSVADPRTGEILKGHVSLGSLRVRQDRLLFEGLAGTANTGTGRPDDPIQIALARIRQLAAHEVGHTLGFAHNFTASTYDDRASVMDYPAPLIRVTANGALDFSDAYGVGIGTWDKVAVSWLYGQFRPDQDEGVELATLLGEARGRGMRYHTDSDARAPGAAQPYANLWDNFADPVTGLENALAVRRIALDRFGSSNLPLGQPLARLEEVLAPVYFHHRYQLEAAIKTVGGVDYEHSRNGDGRVPAPPIGGDQQRAALTAVLSVLDPATLDLPEPLLQLLAPRAPGDSRNPEMFSTGAAPLFDALGATSSAARAVVEGLLRPERCVRVVDQHRRDPTLPSLEEVLNAMMSAAFDDPPESERLAEIHRVVRTEFVRGLLTLAQHPAAPQRVRWRAELQLRLLFGNPLSFAAGDAPADKSHGNAIGAEVTRFLERGHEPARELARPADPPPGSPIGTTLPELVGCSAGG